MRREDHAVRESLHRSGEWLDGLRYALLADEWPVTDVRPTLHARPDLRRGSSAAQDPPRSSEALGCALSGDLREQDV